MNRDLSLSRLRADPEEFDLLIVGGGASGLGAAVEAATRGHRVALIDRGDFGHGTSSRSTKLVHGGVRYLAQGDIGLVRSALRERGLLRQNAPHLVHPLEFVIPNYTWWSGPWYATGLTVYDLLAGARSFGRSRWLSRSETLRRLPNVEVAGLRGGVSYFDGQFDDARLAMNLASTADAAGAVLVNYCACIGLVKDAGQVRGVEARDLETGQEFTVRAKQVLNATGVFVDELRRWDDARVKPLVAASQGVHLVLPRSFLPGSAALMIPRTADGRVLFAIPWHGRLVVGTTDTPDVPISEDPVPLEQEIEFILAHARRYLAHDPSESDVLSVFAGLRPLVQRAGAASTAALSRDHTLAVSPGGLVTLTGGKWTTYRKMGEDAVNLCERTAGLVPRPSVTADRSLHGACDPRELPPALAVYGRDALAIAGLQASHLEHAAPVHPAIALTGAEVVWQVRQEMARTVEDVLARRSRWLLLDARASLAAAPAVARLMAAELGRDARWVEDQVRTYAVTARAALLRASASFADQAAPLVA
jgi:glycerol-3-phosphate dehydrogenase